MAIFFTADTHFGHANIIKYCNRPFLDCKEMDSALFDNWSQCVTEKDTLYHLGDVIFGRNLENAQKYIERIKKLPGTKFLVPGNHDYRYLPQLQDIFTILPEIYTLTVEWRKTSQNLILCHYPMLTWHGIFYGARQLFGHVHGVIEANSKRCDVGVDMWSFAPVRSETLLSYMDSQPDMPIPDKRTEE